MPRLSKHVLVDLLYISSVTSSRPVRDCELSKGPFEEKKVLSSFSYKSTVTCRLDMSFHAPPPLRPLTRAEESLQSFPGRFEKYKIFDPSSKFSQFFFNLVMTA